MVNGVRSAQIAKMMPDWTVSEFFTEFENLFNMLIVVNEEKREVEILFAYKFYENPPFVFLSGILDEFSIKVDEENTVSHRNANIGYSSLSGEYFDYMCVKQSVLDAAVYKDFFNLSEIINHIKNTPDKNALKEQIFRCAASDSEYIAYNDGSGNPVPKKINIFKPVLNNPDTPDDIDIELKIVPVQMEQTDYNIYNGDGRSSEPPLFSCITQVPVLDTDPVYTGRNNNATGDFSIQGAIEDGIDETGKRSNIQLAFYDGLQRVYEKGKEGQPAAKYFDVPFSYTDKIRDFMPDTELSTNPENRSLRLSGSGSLNEIYQKNDEIRTPEEYMIKFIHHRRVDVRSVFVIKNRRFFCKELHYKINQDGADPIVEGVFYEMKN
jgi:hypothetical protein